MTDPQHLKPDKPSFSIDWDAYLPYLESSDLTEAQKREFIETLWSIVMAFVDFGWSSKPLPKDCGEEIDLNSLVEASVVQSSLTSHQNKKKEA